MEAMVVGVGKSVLMGALGYGKTKAGEEVALQLDVEDDGAFIAHELEMMQSFLRTADEERGQNRVLTTWVKHVRDLAYTAENSLMDFSLLSEKKSWWRRPQTMVERRRIAMEMKKLRARVEDVSNRNLRYRHINESSGSKPNVGAEQANIANLAMFGGNEAMFATFMGHEESSEVNLHHLITCNFVDLRVVAVWGTSSDLWKTSAIQEVYDDPKVLQRFGFRAWVKLVHPFNPQEFLRSLVRQFYENSHDEVGKAEQETSVGANVLAKMENMDLTDLVCVFNAQLCSNRYLVVINELCTIEEWHCVKKYFPDNKKRSRIIVSAQQVEIASLCIEKPCHVSKLEQLSCGQTIYLFHKKNSVSMELFDTGEACIGAMERDNVKVMHAQNSAEPISDSNTVTNCEKNAATLTTEIQVEDQERKNAAEEKVHNTTAIKKFERRRTLSLADGRVYVGETDKSIVIKLVGQPEYNQGCKVISIWGMGGLGKTTLARSIYRSQRLGGWKCAWATAFCPFNLEALLRDLALQLQNTIQEDPAGSKETAAQKKSISVMNLQELKEQLAWVLKTKMCLLVLDDISSTSEWDLVKSCLTNAGRIIVTTRERNIARHCSAEYTNMYCLQGLKDDVALDLFIRKVFRGNTQKNYFSRAMMEQARLILKKCNGLPLAILTIGGLLATKPKTATEWRKMNDRINTELEINRELMTIRIVLMKSYDGLPIHLKSAFLYLSIFQKCHIIRCGRLMRRWVAEGYSTDVHGMTAIELCRKYFDELLDRSMIMPGEGINHCFKKINSCQVHDMIREICISKAMAENLVFTLEEGCWLSDTQGGIQHLVIDSNWKRDKDVLKSIPDLSRIRSLTVFGEWRSFFISSDMRFLRVLDLEDTIGLRDHHLHQIGQLRHLIYLSLRGCSSILNLPDSLQNLRHLQTLDIRGTNVFSLLATITNLRKLQNLRADGYWNRGDNVKGEEDIVNKHSGYFYHVPRNQTCNGLLARGLLYLRPQVLDAGLNRYDICSLYRFWKVKVDGVILPRGIDKLKALRTLGFVDVSRSNGKATLEELRELTQLCKLRVAGISGGNSREFWSAIAGHNELQSLAVQEKRLDSEGSPLDGCLCYPLSPPSSLESLTLVGKLANATEWIHKLQNLSKLVLTSSSLEQDDSIQALARLPRLSVLRLRFDSFKVTQLHFQSSSFPSLMVLELNGLDNLESVLFEYDTMYRLELLQVGGCYKLSAFYGLAALISLQEIQLGSLVIEDLKEEVARQVEHMKHVRVNIMD